MQTTRIFPAQQMVKSNSVAAIFHGEVKGNELAKIISHKKAAKGLTNGISSLSAPEMKPLKDYA